MDKNIIIGIVLILIGVLLIVLIPDRGMNKVCYENECFEVEIADDPAERAKGLMFRESLERDKGMLFIFEETGIYPFWMKNTFISLDIIWLDSSGEVVFIKENAMPCLEEPCESFNPSVEARYVLEFSSGFVEEKDVSLGDIFKI